MLSINPSRHIRYLFSFSFGFFNGFLSTFSDPHTEKPSFSQTVFVMSMIETNESSIDRMVVLPCPSPESITLCTYVPSIHSMQDAFHFKLLTLGPIIISLELCGQILNYACLEQKQPLIKFNI